MDAQLITEAIAALGVGGILAWYMWYTTSVTLPKLNETNATAMKDIAQGFRETLKEEREFRREEMADLKETLRETRCAAFVPIERKPSV